MSLFECLKIIDGGQEQPKGISDTFRWFFLLLFRDKSQSLAAKFRYKMHCQSLKLRLRALKMILSMRKSPSNLNCTNLYFICLYPVTAQAQFTLNSPAIAPGAMIPADYACTGSDQSPALAWSNAPQATKSFALIVRDPDAPGGTFIHWVAYNIPAQMNFAARRHATNRGNCWLAEKMESTASAYRLQWPVSSAGENASLSFSSLRAGLDVDSRRQGRCGRGRVRDERSRARDGGIGRHIRTMR